MDDPVIPSSMADLVADVRSSEPAVAERAMARLRDLGAPAVSGLLAALKAEHDTQGRINLGEALAHLGMVAWEPLLAAARDTDELDFGWSVAWALQRFQAVGTVDDFLAALHHPNVHVRWAAALTLGHFADARAVAPLVAALAEDGPVTRRSPREFAPENYYRKVGRCAAKSLRRLGRLALPALLSALRSDTPLVRAGAADALTGMDEPQALDPLTAATRDLDAAVRRHAFQAVAALLPALGPERQLEAREVLLSALLEPDQEAQLAAVRGLCTLGEQAATPLVGMVLDRQWDAEHPYTRSYAMRALACLLAKEPPIPGLEQQLFGLLVGTLHEHANPSWLRREAATALGKTRDARAVDSLMLALIDPSPDTRGAVAEALRLLGDRRTVPALKQALQVARAEAGGPNAEEVLQWLLDELEESITALSATPEGDGA
jgi:HEAT repeat protein